MSKIISFALVVLLVVIIAKQFKDVVLQIKEKRAQKKELNDKECDMAEKTEE